MKQTALLITISLLLIGLTLPSYVSAAETAAPDIVGQWRMKSVNTEGPPMNAIMTISKDKDGKLTGKWLSFFGPADLKDIKFENDKLTFSQTVRMRDEDFTSDFTGTLRDGKLKGIMSNDFADTEMEGTLMSAKPAILGTWEITTKRQDQEMTSTLLIKADKDGKLVGTWKSQRGESEIPEILFKDNKLNFKRKMTRQDQEFEIEYDLTIKGNELSGVTKTQRGEMPVTGKKADSPAIGTWDLTLASERGDRKQVLMIFPDMTALYGADDLDSITIDGNNISFKMSRTFGDRSWQMEFKGTVDGDKLAGEMTNSFSETPTKVTGTKLK